MPMSQRIFSTSYVDDVLFVGKWYCGTCQLTCLNTAAEDVKFDQETGSRDLQVDVGDTSLFATWVEVEAYCIRGLTSYPKKFRLKPFLDNATIMDSDIKSRICCQASRLLEIDVDLSGAHDAMCNLLALWARSGYPLDFIRKARSKRCQIPSLVQAARKIMDTGIRRATTTTFCIRSASHLSQTQM